MKKYLLSLLFVLCAVAAQAQDVRIANQYFITNDTNPTTQVWSTPLGQFVANSDATFATWLNANDGRADRVCNVQGSANNGSGKLRVTCGSTSNIQTGQVFNYCGNLTGCAGAAAGTVVDATHLDFTGIAYSGTADTGGVVWSATVIPALANVAIVINNANLALWSAVSGYTSVSSPGNIIETGLAGLPAKVLDVAISTSGKNLQLLQANLVGGPPIGVLQRINNIGTNAFQIRDFAGIDTIITLNPGDSADVWFTGFSVEGGPKAVLYSGYVATSFSPIDQSGAGLSFSSIDFKYEQIGNLVYLYGMLTYPVTADGNNATISLPVPVANVTRAQTPAQVGNNTGVTNLQVLPVQGTSTAVFRDFTTGGAKTNANMTGTRVRFMLIYPAS